MNPLEKRLAQVESELTTIQARTRSLSETVRGLRKDMQAEAAEEVVILSEKESQPEIAPPPLPVQAPVTIPFTIPQLAKVATPVEPVPHNEETEETGGLEMQLGRVWSVRLGIVLLTTGFVFLSRYTYDTIIRDLGPGVRLTLMYLMSFLLTGVGLFCERWKESLKTYGGVVAAGGLAAIFYCGFAAHNVEALRVIESPVLASIVLTLSAALFCAVSLWRESRVMLSASLALAFYSISVNPIGWMACLSALVLASFGIAMMIRYRWMEVGFLVLIGSYLSFTWWQFAIGFGAGEASRWFLPAYWTLFAVASLIPKNDLDEKNHLLFSSINHGAFFFLFSFHLESGQWMERHWLFCFIFGAVLMAISFLTRGRMPERSRLAHLVKGIGLITLGLAILLDGHHLFLAFLIEALVLMALNLKHPHTLKKGAAWAVALLSLLALGEVIPAEVHPVIWLGGIVGWLAFGHLHRWIETDGQDETLHAGGFFAALIALGLLVFGLMPGWTHLDQALTLAVLGLLSGGLLLSAPMRRHSYDPLIILTVTGFLGLVSFFAIPALSLKMLAVAMILALLSSVAPTLARQRCEDPAERQNLHVFIGGLIAIALGFAWLLISRSELSVMSQVFLVLVIPIVGTLTARFTGLLAHSLLPFAFHLALFQLPILVSPVLLMGLCITVAHYLLIRRIHRLPDLELLRDSLFVIAAGFWGSWLVVTLTHPAFFLTGTAVAILLGARWFGGVLSQVVAGPFFIIGIAAAFLSPYREELYLCLAAPLALHLFRTAKGQAQSYLPMTLISLLALWTRITLDADIIPLAAAWAALGTTLLLTGLGLKSRCFRLIGLIILAASLGHLMTLDLVKLDPLPRILSFMTLGLGLLGLGFVYNRYSDRLKQIL